MISRNEDLIGKTFGGYFVHSFNGKDKKGQRLWQCECKCGEISIKSTGQLSKNKVGCFDCGVKYSSELAQKHSMTDTRVHNIWKGIKERCYNKNEQNYANYGGRGITICDEWLHDFIPFYTWAINNGYSENLTIDRIDNEKGYSPDNCRWATMKQQNNNRRDNVFHEINGEKHTLSEWCDIYNVPYWRTKSRLSYGIDILTALTTEKQKPFGFKKNWL